MQHFGTVTVALVYAVEISSPLEDFIRNSCEVNVSNPESPTLTPCLLFILTFPCAST